MPHSKRKSAAKDKKKSAEMNYGAGFASNTTNTSSFSFGMKSTPVATSSVTNGPASSCTMDKKKTGQDCKGSVAVPAKKNVEKRNGKAVNVKENHVKSRALAKRQQQELNENYLKQEIPSLLEQKACQQAMLGEANMLLFDMLEEIQIKDTKIQLLKKFYTEVEKEMSGMDKGRKKDVTEAACSPPEESVDDIIGSYSFINSINAILSCFPNMPSVPD